MEKIFNSLDPIRLLKQIRNMQDALWQHAVIGMAESSKPVSQVNFNPDIGALPKNDQMELSGSRISKELNGTGKATIQTYKKTKGSALLAQSKRSIRRSVGRNLFLA